MTDSRLWDRPRYPGHGPAMHGFGGVAAPLLAGFTLTAILTLVTTDEAPPLVEWAVLVFSLATGAFLFAIQFTFLALAYWVLPSDHLQWAPEARCNYEELEGVILRQRTSVREFQRYADTAWNLFHIGVLGLLCGVAVLLVPEENNWSAPRVAGTSAIVVALLTQIAWISDPWLNGRLSRWAMHALPTKIHAPPNISPDLVRLVADTDHNEAMKEEARHRNACAWTTLDEVTIGPSGLTHFRNQPVSPTVETQHNGRYFAMTGSGDNVVAVLPDRVLYGCKEHVLERLARFGQSRDGSAIKRLRDAIERA